MTFASASCGAAFALISAQPPRVVGGVLLERRGVLRAQRRQRLLDRVGLLDGVGERDEGVRVDAAAVARA